MKRLPQCLLGLLLLYNFPVWAVDIYVAVNGSDVNDGSKEKPLATVSAAIRKAREMRRLKDAGISTGIHILITEGIYNLYEPIDI
jgi:hypothetical protein